MIGKIRNTSYVMVPLERVYVVLFCFILQIFPCVVLFEVLCRIEFYMLSHAAIGLEILLGGKFDFLVRYALL